MLSIRFPEPAGLNRARSRVKSQRPRNVCRLAFWLTPALNCCQSICRIEIHEKYIFLSSLAFLFLTVSTWPAGPGEGRCWNIIHKYLLDNSKTHTGAYILEYVDHQRIHTHIRISQTTHTHFDWKDLLPCDVCLAPTVVRFLDTFEEQNKTQTCQKWNTECVRCFHTRSLTLRYRREPIIVHSSWTIIIHDRRRDQVNMSPLTRWRGAGIYCTRLGSISKVQLSPLTYLAVSQPVSRSPQVGALVQHCEVCLESSPLRRQDVWKYRWLRCKIHHYQSIKYVPVLWNNSTCPQVVLLPCEHNINKKDFEAEGRKIREQCRA